MKETKTIFITNFNPFSTRNILMTDILDTILLKTDIKIVILCSDYKKDFLNAKFGSKRVVIEGVRTQTLSFLDIILRFLASNIFDNNTKLIHQKIQYFKNKKLTQYIFARFLGKIGKIKLFRSLIRFSCYLLISKDKFCYFFEKYNPILVFSSDIFHDDDIHFIAEAKRRGIKTVSMIRSWDNITNKGFFRITPDILIVNNDITKNEAIKYEDMNQDKIFVGGMPQLDYYFNYVPSDKSSFFNKIGFDSNKPLIMFSPHGSRFHDTDWQIMQILKEARISGAIPEDVQFLIRFPLNDTVQFGNFIPDDHFFIDKPGIKFEKGGFKDQEFRDEDIVRLADTLYFSKFVITYNSSIIIDASAFGKPTIGIAFDGWEKKQDIYRSVGRFMEYEHTKYVIKTGGFLIVNNKEELIKAINNYLKNPDSSLISVKKILETQSGGFDGKSGNRIGSFLISEINK